MFLYVGEELFCVGAVDDSMIKAERKISQMPDRNVVFTIRRRENLWPLLNLTDAENCDLGLIDDGCAEQTTEDAWIGNGKCPTGNFVRLELFGARAIRQVVCRASEPRNR